MSDFVSKAATKIDKLSPEQIKGLLDRRKAELDVRDAVLNNIREGYFVCNAEKEVVFINNACLQDLLPVKSSYDENRVCSVREVIAERNIVDFVIKCIEGNISYPEMFFEYNNKKESIALINNFKSSNIVFRVQDITIFEKMREQFKKNESLAALTTAAAGVTHEIKNPLASLSIYLQLLVKKFKKKGNLSSEDALPSLAVMQEEIERINKIANDFNFAVRPMNSVLKILNVNDVLEEIYNFCKEEMRLKKIKFTLNKSSDLPNIFADKDLVKQAVFNLLRNSMQAIVKNGEIVLSSFAQEGNVCISVSDNGCGMSDDVKSHIFEPYFTTKAQGTGIGLTMLYKILKEHDADITVDSEEGKGSVFTLMFPVPNSERFKLEENE